MENFAHTVITEVNTGLDEATIAWLGPVFSIALLVALVVLVRSFIKQSRRAREATWESDSQESSDSGAPNS